MQRSFRNAFTLIELLVVISIIALLIGILLPALGAAREQAKTSVNLSNHRQMGTGVAMYLAEYNQTFFAHEGYYLPSHKFVEYNIGSASPAPEIAAIAAAMPSFSDSAELSAAVADPNKPGLAIPYITATNASAKTRKAHWPDYIFGYAPEPKIYTSPFISAAELQSLNVNIVIENVYGRVKWGGYGYNQHYLGWEAVVNTDGTVATPAYYGKVDKEVMSPSNTVVIGDSAGSRNTATFVGNSYAIEAPLPSVNHGWKFGAYYKSSAATLAMPRTNDAEITARAAAAMGEETALTKAPGNTDWLYRIYPAPRNNGNPAFVFGDGHAAARKLSEIDDFNQDGVFDNGYWNGRANFDPVTGR